NLYNPLFLSVTPPLPRPTIQSINEELSAPSLAISDTLGFMDDKLRITLGGRYQWIKQKVHVHNNRGVYQRTNHMNESRFSPMFMAAWSPTQDLVVYGNYLEDLEPGSMDDDTGAVTKPRVSRQVELGVRKNWGNIVTSANIYQMRRQTFWRNTGEHQGYERVRGLELNAYANLMNKTLRPYLGLSFIRHQLIDSPAAFVNVLLNGDQVSSPRFIAKAGVEWDTLFLQGLTLNAG
ncbi:TonB-dependent receptor, partial [Vibrio alginolyticus]|nr:TonB-dependent receptor [Vibrio alginolyticus]